MDMPLAIRLLMSPVGAALSVTVLPLMDLMVVPAGMPGPTSVIPGAKPCVLIKVTWLPVTLTTLLVLSVSWLVSVFVNALLRVIAPVFGSTAVIVVPGGIPLPEITLPTLKRGSTEIMLITLLPDTPAGRLPLSLSTGVPEMSLLNVTVLFVLSIAVTVVPSGTLGPVIFMPTVNPRPAGLLASLMVVPDSRTKRSTSMPDGRTYTRSATPICPVLLALRGLDNVILVTLPLSSVSMAVMEVPSGYAPPFDAISIPTNSWSLVKVITEPNPNT